MLNDQQLEEALDKSPAPRVTKEYMDSRVADTSFISLGGTVTLCQITLDNGYSVRGESACADPANYNQEIGERIAYDDAYKKLWPLYGFLLMESRFQSQLREIQKAEAASA